MKTAFRDMTLPIVCLLAVLAFSMCACKSILPASVPSDQKTPVVVNTISRDVLIEAIKYDNPVLASALESNTEGGSVLYVDHWGFIFTPDGNVVFGKDGEPLRLHTRVIAKLHSLADFQQLEGVAEVEYVIGGFQAEPLPDNMRHLVPSLCPVALQLRLKGLNAATVASQVPASREAAAKERAAILNGLAALAEARGAAFATKVEAMADGIVKVVTATGKEIIGRVTGTHLIDAAVDGAGTVIEATMKQGDGSTTKVVAEGDNAAALSQ